MNKFDLHIHSELSDGDFTITELMKKIRNAGIEVFSIADHDNLKSYELLKDRELKKIRYISGVEISAYLEYKCFHILGYNYHGNISALEELINKIHSKRIERAKEMIDKIELNNNFKFRKEEVADVLKHPSVGKKHVAKMMIKNNIGSDYKEILKKYMTGLHLPTSYRVSVNEASDAIKSSGGIPVLAHPKEYELRYDIKIEDYIENLIAAGIRGIEVYHSIHSKEDIKRYLEIAHKYNLITTGGSDFHGPSKSSVTLGTLSKDEIEISELPSIVDYLDKRKTE